MGLFDDRNGRKTFRGNKFAIGQIVQHGSGGPEMKVLRVLPLSNPSKRPSYLCEWEVSGFFQTREFEEHMLR